MFNPHDHDVDVSMSRNEWLITAGILSACAIAAFALAWVCQHVAVHVSIVVS